MRANQVAVFVFLVVLAAVGCHKNSSNASNLSVVIPPVPPRAAPLSPVPPGPEPLPRIELPPAPLSLLEQATLAFVAGNYDEAERYFEQCLQDPSFTEHRDNALYHLGLIRALRPTPAAERQRSIATLKQLIEQYPNSPFLEPAKLILSLHGQVAQAANDARARDQKLKQLAVELDRLKKIDADRRKRP
jgi:tetratricopeptide (TPR) repeat protein